MDIQPAPSEARPAAPRQPVGRVTLFIRMWACAHIIHLLIANDYALDSPWNIGVVGTAMAVLLRPDSARLLGAMLLLQLADYAFEMPLGPDHWALIALVNLVLLVTLAMRRSASTSGIDVAFPAARAVLLIAYVAAAISKYNIAFLDPLTSCANAIAGTVTFGLVPSMTSSPVVAGAVVVVETSVAVLLLIPRTRCAGVLLGMSFHYTLSATPAFIVPDFTSAVYALFLLFLPTAEVERMREQLTRLASRSSIVRDARRKPPLTIALAFLVLGFGGYASAAVTAAVGFVLAQIYIVTLLIVGWRSIDLRRAGARFGSIKTAHLPVIALALVWALSPYLGLRTTGVFTMFSGIKTEAAGPNHLFMPSLHLTDWQEDMVVLRSSNDPELSLGARTSLAIPLIALRRYATDNPDLQVLGTLDGATVSFGPLPGQTRLDPLPYWLYKTMLFRPVAPTGTPFCSVS